MDWLILPLARAIAQQVTQPGPVSVPKPVLPNPLDVAVEMLDQLGKGLSFFTENDVVPQALPSYEDPQRPVAIACHPAGVGLGDIVKEDIEKMEKAAGQTILDPTYHWAVVVGDYYHELNPKGISGNFEIQNGYQNGEMSDGKVWSHRMEVGYTKYNDAAIVAAGRAAIAAMPKTYNLISNNCQTFVVGLIHIISPDTNLLGVVTLEALVDYMLKESTDSKEATQKQIELVKAQNVPAVNAAAAMQVITPTQTL
ncbi:hypothetical protein AAF712_016083 [Marasmius tenuissimus]|uniref:LRAT domain-containing protein n=1 Tax=Marasmius tenuissimus TaxID=585030 RepID=A0ABR2Z7M6_9AGAR